MAVTLLDIDEAGTDTYGSNKICQSITPDADWLVETVWIGVIWAGNPVTCYIMDDDSNKPGSTLATSDAQAVVGAPTDPSPETFTFTPYQLTSGVKYWLGFWSSGDAYTIRTNNSPYSGGSIGYHNSVIWIIDASYDMKKLKVNGTIVTSGAVISSVARRGSILRRRR
jgi:hypothetical protein